MMSQPNKTELGYYDVRTKHFCLNSFKVHDKI